MRLFAAIILLISLPLSALAQNTTIQASDVIAAISDYKDDTYYRAVLVQGSEDADLYIFTGEPQAPQLAVYARNIVVTGIGGIDAELKLSPSGALQVVSQNIAIGRDRWEQTLTILYRNKQFVVGGYTYSYYDTLSADDNGNIKSGKCDLNLLTGKGIKDGKHIKAGMKAVPVEKWTTDVFPDVCGDD